MRQTSTVETPRPRGGALSGSGTGTGTGFATAHQTIEPRTLPLNAPNRDPGDRPQHGTLSPDEEALRSESGAEMQPVPQGDRDRGDDLPYNKRVSRRTCPICPFLVLIVGA
jgi:hypothetical protein